jgi:hypothetical protein
MMTKSRFSDRLEDWEDPDEATMHDFWEKFRAEELKAEEEPESPGVPADPLARQPAQD